MKSSIFFVVVRSYILAAGTYLDANKKVNGEIKETEADYLTQAQTMKTEKIKENPAEEALNP